MVSCVKAAYPNPPSTLPIPTSTDSESVRVTAQARPSQTPPEIPNGQIAYVGNDGDLQILDLLTGDSRQLTSGEHVYSPAWSPDGKRIAYIRDTDVAEQKEIVLLDITSQMETAIPESRLPMLADVTWSPDGHFVVGDLGCCVTGRSLVLFDADNKRIYKKITYSQGYAWSPDGKRLALGRAVPLQQPISVESGDSSSVILLDLQTGAEKLIAQGSRESLYSPDCWLSVTTLIYRELVWNEQNQRGDYKLWQVMPDIKGKPVELASGTTPDCDNNVAYNALPSNLRAAGVGRVSWSPDRQWAVLSINNGTTRTIYLLQIASHSVHQLMDGNEPFWQPN
jgi:Tol biopolymer transport system component